MTSKTGTLFIVGTPIGNFADISQRAIDTLKSVELIAAEDTRVTGLLLKDKNISTCKISYHEFSKSNKQDLLIAKLLGGENIALVTDAGMPGISDPGYRLVSEAITKAIPIKAIPGPTAVTTALAISGFPADRFVFEGFLPNKTNQRKQRLTELQAEQRTLVVYEAPHRIEKMLVDALEILGDRRCCITRELTKKYEEILYLTISKAIMHFAKSKPRGEFTIVISGAR